MSENMAEEKINVWHWPHDSCHLFEKNGYNWFQPFTFFVSACFRI